MGLDMYLEARRSCWFDEDDKKARIESGDFGLSGYEIKEITRELMYWRKANAIHKWFVDNVQDGIDDCRSAYVTLDDLRAFQETVNKVLGSRSEAVAKELLPSQGGFFFGTTEYGEWYWSDLGATKTFLDGFLGRADLEEVMEKWEIYYSSSW